MEDTLARGSGRAGIYCIPVLYIHHHNPPSFLDRVSVYLDFIADAHHIHHDLAKPLPDELDKSMG